MRITITNDRSEVIDQINVEDEIGDITKPLPQQELIARVIEARRIIEREADKAWDLA